MTDWCGGVVKGSIVAKMWWLSGRASALFLSLSLCFSHTHSLALTPTTRLTGKDSVQRCGETPPRCHCCVESCGTGGTRHVSSAWLVRMSVCRPLSQENSRPLRPISPPWRQPKGKLTVSSVNFHTNATRIGWHLWEIDLRFAPGLPPGWLCYP